MMVAHMCLCHCSCSVGCCQRHKELCLSVPTQHESAVDPSTKVSCQVDDSLLAEEGDTLETAVLDELSELGWVLAVARGREGEELPL